VRSRRRPGLTTSVTRKATAPTHAAFALLFSVGAVLVLRRRRPDAHRPFRTPGYPWVSLAFLAGTLAGLAAIVWGEIDQAAFSRCLARLDRGNLAGPPERCQQR